jgi:hypothetical protein
MSSSLPLKQLVKSLVPTPILNRYLAKRIGRKEKTLAGETLQETFSNIYSSGLWGTSEAGYYSGFGSHDEAVVGPYVAAVRSFVSQIPRRLDAVDLGCGDFNVGRQLRNAFGGYTGCDVVPGLIADNRRRYADLDVRFEVVNIASDPLPPGDVVLVRQVLQHLSNADIGAALAKLGAYQYAIVTEHLPARQGFKANVDKPSGAQIRIYFDSGIVLTEPPFSLKPLSETVLCELPQLNGMIRTIAYKLR